MPAIAYPTGYRRNGPRTTRLLGSRGVMELALEQEHASEFGLWLLPNFAYLKQQLKISKKTFYT
eukprot:scaffold23549_cov92-Amphora_coffeaeformis.AAC.1